MMQHQHLGKVAPCNGDWSRAEIHNEGQFVGCGATCRNHVNTGERGAVICKKMVTLGSNSGLSCSDLMLRLKRWLIAGLDDTDWEEDCKRTKHVSMGGRHMREFAEGFSEEVCDRIACGTLSINELTTLVSNVKEG